MTRYAIVRVLQAVAVLWAAFTVSFAVLYLLPGDPVELAANATPGTPVDPAAIAEMRARYGLDQPVWQQYWTALAHAVRGDLGRSIGTGQSVTGAIGAALPSTLGLAALTLLLAVGFGGVLAVTAAYTERRWLRGLLTALPPMGAAAPTFWVGLLLLQLFSFRLRLFPAFGGTGFEGAVLPAITLAVPVGAVIAQVLYSSLIQTWRQPFVAVAFAKGASRRWVQARHVLRPALAPALTIAGVWVGTVLAGSVVVETVFSRAGIGRLTQTAVLDQDIPVVQGIVVCSALVFVVVNLVVDLVLPLFDPRIVRGNRIGGA
ncbi:ABC transporter permease [Nocardia sp. CDC159]|uniref:ABC transporter permease n=1 Tax=Nocardia pulmonis TaxID=2951408 RepID=A0A9X2E2D8_9NOCA|nr:MULTISPECIES: ABC transporter permease [Nocardia]MCM6772624.1 ABC transporter permease [Nocardia pulmonis]MCM6786073.1 ABC transporter permease [Nocardia sp. CDC159]